MNRYYEIDGMTSLVIKAGLEVTSGNLENFWPNTGSDIMMYFVTF